MTQYNQQGIDELLARICVVLTIANAVKGIIGTVPLAQQADLKIIIAQARELEVLLEELTQVSKGVEK